jgi:hypothetical protein
MLKRIILACALAAVSSFATWDLFPVLENHKGQAKLGASTFYREINDHDMYALILGAGARYTVIQDLELALDLPYRMFTYIDGENADIDGFGDLHFSTRYQFIPTMNVFVDVYAPVRHINDGSWDFDVGLQFSRQIDQLLSFGSQLGASFTIFRDQDYIPLYVNGAACIRFAVTPQFTPYFGPSFTLFLGHYYDDGNHYFHGSGDLYLGPYVGAIYDFNDFVSIDFWAKIGQYVNVKDYFDPTIYTGLYVLINF